MWWCTDKLNSTTDHFRLPSVAWKRRVLKLPNSCGQPRRSNCSPPRGGLFFLFLIFGIDVAILVCNFQSKNWLNCRIKGHLFPYHKLLGAFVVVCPEFYSFFKPDPNRWFSVMRLDGHVGAQNNGEWWLMVCITIKSNSQTSFCSFALYTNMVAMTPGEKPPIQVNKT